MNHANATYQLYYWPGIQGRGEFVRLALEDAGASYVDVARQPPVQGGGVPALMAMMRDPGAGVLAPFAPPFLRHGELVIAQTANILAYLAPRHGLVPEAESARVAAHQLQLTIADLVKEAHDTHHPIASGLYYEDQKPEAQRYAESFVRERVPKYLGYFERAIERNAAGRSAHLLGAEHSYVDLSMYQVLVGLAYAFPRAMASMTARIPRLQALRARVEQRPRVHAYLASPRRLPFNENGIFRHYPELDGEVPHPAG